MKITRDEMFFSKDLIHTLAYVGMFAAAIISVGACKSGIWVAAILAWIVAGIIIGLAIISDYKKAELLKNGTRIIGKVTATKRVHIKFHLSTYHLADEDVIYPYVVHYQYKVKGETYNGKSQWFWFNPCIPKGTPIKILVDPKNPTRSTVLNPENQGCEKASKEKNMSKFIGVLLVALAVRLVVLFFFKQNIVLNEISLVLFIAVFVVAVIVMLTKWWKWRTK